MGAARVTITLANLELLVNHYAEDNELDIEAAPGLTVANMIYQQLAADPTRRWPEFTRRDTSITTTVGQEAETWPTSPVFVEEPYIEWQRDGSRWQEIRPAKNEDEWRSYDLTSNSSPKVYRKASNGTIVQLLLRPFPDQARSIRITGRVEVAALSGIQGTIFLNNNSDHALALKIAADYKRKRAKSNSEHQRALELELQADSLLPPSSHSPLRDKGQIRPYQM